MREFMLHLVLGASRRGIPDKIESPEMVHSHKTPCEGTSIVHILEARFPRKHAKFKAKQVQEIYISHADRYLASTIVFT